MELNFSKDKIPVLVNLTVTEAQSVIEALATKATKEAERAREFESENNSLSDRTYDLENRVRIIEQSINKEGK